MNIEEQLTSDIREHINELFVHLFTSIHRLEENELKRLGLTEITLREVHIIDAIGLTGALTMGDAASKLQISLGTLTTAIKRLEHKGYVRRVRSTIDKRVFTIELLEKGIHAYELHRQFHEALTDRIMEEMNASADIVLAESLIQIISFFRHIEDIGIVVPSS